jgi:hypothetical protein
MADPTVALRELHRARRKARFAHLDWFEAVYRVYLAAAVGVVVTLFVSSWLGDAPLTAAQLDEVQAHGPAVVGLVTAAVAALGLRSGSRGGPLAMEPAEVRYVLLAPVDRRRALLGHALRQLRFGVFVGAVTGAVAGQLAHQRLPGPALQWLVAGAALGVVLSLGLLGAALLASGLRLRRWIATLAALAIVAWAAADLLGSLPAPTTTVGSLALWPLEVVWLDLVAPVAVVAATLAGLALLGRVSLELLEVRTALVGQLRFAVTVQDLRTVIVLRRQLALDTPRLRPWVTLGPRSRHTAWRRGWHGLLRFPAVRLGRMLTLGALAGLAMAAAFRGSSALVAPAAAALFLAGLDAIEPLSQELDHPDRHETLPVERGLLLTRLVAAPAVALVPVAAAVVGGWAVLDRTALGLAALAALPAVWCGAGGAAVSVGMGAPKAGGTQQLLPPEAAGFTIAIRTAWPLVVALLGTLPAVVARHGAADGDPALVAGAPAVSFALLVCLAVVAWLRFRDAASAWWRQAIEETQQTRRPA